MPDDELRTGLIQAIASELIGLGYRATATRGYTQQSGKPIRFVADETWYAMKKIAASGEPQSTQHEGAHVP